MRRILLIASLAIAGCAPSTKPPVVVDQASISREQAIQERMAASPPPVGGAAMGRVNAERAFLNLAKRNTALCDGWVEMFEGQPYCTMGFKIVEDRAVNAFASGKAVYITTGMLAFLRSDEEVALVIGHEMAHNLLDHHGKKSGNEILGAIVGGAVGGAIGMSMTDAGMAAGRGAYSQAFETEADYLGMILAARAGYNVASAPALWRRMAMVDPKAIHASFGSTHPSSVERFLNLEAAAREIERKRAAGLPLVPEKR